MWPFGNGRKGAPGFSSSSTAEEVTRGIDGSALTAIVTGASSGLGEETTRILALRGVHVVMVVRNVESGRNVKEAILKETPDARIDVMQLDLSSMASVRKFASEYTSLGLPLNLLINNAGIMASPFMLSGDNIEMQFATNHIGHFLLTNLLLETMKSTARESNREGRIVNLSSTAHRYPYHEGIRFDKINDEPEYRSIRDYGQSKLASILHANELARRLKEDGADITANSIHPGGIFTNLFRHNTLLKVFSNFEILRFWIKFLALDASFANTIGRLRFKTVQQGAATTCYVALHPQVAGVTGEYFEDCNIGKLIALAKDAELAKKLWAFSLSLINTDE